MLRLAVALCAAASLASALPSPIVTETTLWPLPKNSQSGAQNVAVIFSPGKPFFTFESVEDASVPATLTAAFSRYTDITFPHVVPASPASGITGLTVSVADTDESHPSVETDESYQLNVPVPSNNPQSTVATLSAKTIYGAMRGLETFSQLVFFDFDSETYEVRSAPWTIYDAPRFPHRGLMIDSARHFETLQSIREIIDTLPYSKLNVLHWHMVDSQSFPFQCKKFPKLWNGAYSDVEKFTQADIATVVEYARMRGVRVIVEFDVPGHAQSWCAGYPEICPSPTCPTPLNVANNMTFEVIEGILEECTGGKASTKDVPSGLFPDDFIHLGGDEVNTNCWGSTPAVKEWLDERNMTGDDGYAYFVKRAASIALSMGRRPVQWSEVYDHFKTKLDKRTVVHIWKPNTNVTEVVANGYNVLINVGYVPKSWYLDNLNVNASAVYSNEPCAGVPDDLCGMIYGGHGEMWGETVDTSDLQQTVWPRLAAIGERLWSPRADVGNWTEAQPRLEAFRCLLNRRGVKAAPVNNADAREAPPGPNSCLLQRRR